MCGPIRVGRVLAHDCGIVADCTIRIWPFVETAVVIVFNIRISVDRTREIVADNVRNYIDKTGGIVADNIWSCAEITGVTVFNIWRD